MENTRKKNAIIDRVKELPSIPHVIRRLLPLMDDERVNIQDLVNTISYDPAISSRLLKVSNSAYYGFMSKIATVRHAITVLGLRQVRSLALGISVIDAIKRLDHDAAFDHQSLWTHSIAAANAAELLSALLQDVDSDTAFTASLLHDIGKIPLATLFPDDYLSVRRHMEENDAAQYQAEEKIFGFEHGLVAGWLCESWKLPKVLTFPIMYHHHIRRSEPRWRTMTALVHCSDCIAWSAGFGCSVIKIDGSALDEAAGHGSSEEGSGGAERPSSSISDVIIQEIGIPPDDIDTITEKVYARRSLIDEFFTALS